MPEGSLHGDDVAPGGDEARREEVPEVVQSETPEAGDRGGLPPQVADGVLVRGSAGARREQPAFRTATGQVLLDVRGDEVQQPVGDDDRALGAVLGRPQFHGPTGAALNLPADEQAAAEEVVVAG